MKGNKLQALTLVFVLVLAAGLANKYLETNIDVSDIVDLYGELQTKINVLNGTLQTTINSTFYTMQKPYSYIVGSVVSGETTYYTLQNGTTGSLDWYSTNKTAVQEAATGNLTSGGSIYLKNIEWDTNLSYTDITIIEDYQGTVNYYGADSFYFEGNNRTDLLANPQEAWSYLIYKDGSNYKAKASNGTICWESTNFVTVIQSAIDDIESDGGGTININKALYTISSSITIDISYNTWITLWAESGTVFRAGANDITLIEVNNADNLGASVTLHGINMDSGTGSYTDVWGVVIEDSYGVIVENAQIKNLEAGIVLQNMNYYTESTTIRNMEFTNNTKGIWFHQVGETYFSFSQTHIYDTDIDVATSSQRGIQVDNSSDLCRSQITATMWLDANTTIGFYLEGGDVSGSTLILNFEGAHLPAVTFVYPIILDGGSVVGGSVCYYSVIGGNVTQNILNVDSLSLTNWIDTS